MFLTQRIIKSVKNNLQLYLKKRMMHERFFITEHALERAVERSVPVETFTKAVKHVCDDPCSILFNGLVEKETQKFNIGGFIFAVSVSENGNLYLRTVYKGK